MPYKVYDEFPLERILPLITNNEKERIKFGKFNVRVGSTRLQTLGKSQRCVCCGREGVVFRLEITVRKGVIKEKKILDSLFRSGCVVQEHVKFKLELEKANERRRLKKERDLNYSITPHLNLYAIEYIPIKRRSKRKFRRYVLMTRDHIYPRSLGGPDTIDNSQTMCERCNSKKSDKIDVKHITQPMVQEMLKNISVSYPIIPRKNFAVNF